MLKAIILFFVVMTLSGCSSSDGKIENKKSTVDYQEETENQKDEQSTKVSETLRDIESDSKEIITENTDFYRNRLINDSIIFADWIDDGAIYENELWIKRCEYPIVPSKRIILYNNMERSSDHTYLNSEDVAYADKTDRNNWVHVTCDNGKEGWLYFIDKGYGIEIEENENSFADPTQLFWCLTQRSDYMYASAVIDIGNCDLLKEQLGDNVYSLIWFDDAEQLIGYADENAEKLGYVLKDIIIQYAEQYRDWEHFTGNNPFFCIYISRIDGNIKGTYHKYDNDNNRMLFYEVFSEGEEVFYCQLGVFEKEFDEKNVMIIRNYI